jgi:ribosomal protein S18 acetylase RimI-like enzyme
MMKKIILSSCSVNIHEIAQTELDSVLEVYKMCEDFLALGPVAMASMEMVQKDIGISQSIGGKFCGIFASTGEMIGVIDYVPDNFEGDPQQAYLSLLMIAAPFRCQGIGEAVIKSVETEIKQNPKVTVILAGVQVNNPLAVKFWQKLGYQIISGPELMPDQTIVYGLRKNL